MAEIFIVYIFLIWRNNTPLTIFVNMFISEQKKWLYIKFNEDIDCTYFFNIAILCSVRILSKNFFEFTSWSDSYFLKYLKYTIKKKFLLWWLFLQIYLYYKFLNRISYRLFIISILLLFLVSMCLWLPF